MQLILVSLGRAPEVPAMSFELDLVPTLHLLLGGPSAEDVEGRHLVDPVLVVVGLNPLIDAGYLIPPVHIARTGHPIVWEPDQLRCRQEGSNGEGVCLTWVDPTGLVGNIMPKSLKLFSEGFEIPTSDQVVQTSNLSLHV